MFGPDSVESGPVFCWQSATILPEIRTRPKPLETTGFLPGIEQCVSDR